MPVLCQEYMLFFCLPLSIQPRLNTQQQGRATRCGTPHPARPCCCVLSLCWILKCKQKNSITLGRGSSSTTGNMGAKYVQEFGPRFLACHAPNLAFHGVSISCVSMSSVSCCVIILRVSVSVPCRGHPAFDIQTLHI